MKRLILLLTLGLAACAVPRVAASLQTPPPATATAALALALLPDNPTPGSSFLLPPSSFAPTQPFAPDCAETQGTVTNHNHHSRTLGYSLFYDIYLPACYDESGDDYPLLYLLHGQNFIEDQWDRLGADEAADSLIASGQAPPFIIVMPRGGANSYFGEGLVKDLLPFVETEYRIRRDRRDRAIGGLSRGAGWAIYLGLLHPDLFGAIGAHSPAIQYIHAPQIDNLLDALPPDGIPRIFLDIGEDDSLIGNTRWFTDMLDERHLPYTFKTYPGKHDEAYWSAHVREYLRFYTQEW